MVPVDMKRSNLVTVDEIFDLLESASTVLVDKYFSKFVTVDDTALA